MPQGHYGHVLGTADAAHRVACRAFDVQVVAAASSSSRVFSSGVANFKGKLVIIYPLSALGLGVSFVI